MGGGRPGGRECEVLYICALCLVVVGVCCQQTCALVASRISITRTHMLDYVCV